MNNNGTTIDKETLGRLAELDKKGFIFPPGAAPPDVLDGARKTLDWARTIREDLADRGRTEVMGEEFTEQQLIPGDILKECLQPAQERYRISPDWTPAFFSNKVLPWYVGGACFHLREGNFARVCFVLRNSFRTRRKWLLYSRREIVSHEIAHAARSMMGQKIFEEPLAYRISESRFRRGFGPMFRGTWEALALLGGSLLLMAGSMARTFGAPASLHYGAASPLILTGAVLGLRAANAHAKLKKAIEHLAVVYGTDAEAAAFRCTDREIRELADADDPRKILEQYAHGGESCMRWAVINQRFGGET